MTKAFGCLTRGHLSSLLFLLWVCALPSYGSTLSVAIGGGEQGSGSLWDAGTLSLTVNGHSEVVSYGQLSRKDTVASDLATLFTLDCQSPVTATSQGNMIIFTTRQAGSIAPVTAVSVWDTADFTQASFYLQGGSSGGGTTPSLALSCTPNPVPAGESVMCSAVFPQGVTGTVGFALDGGAAWSTTSVTLGGLAESSSLSGVAAGSHTVVASYSGDSNYGPTTQSVTLTGISGPLASQGIYSYGLTYQANNNIATANDQVNGQWRGLQYDTLNRLVGGTLTPASGTGPRNWCWTYDGFGNRTEEADSSSTFSAGCTTTGSLNLTTEAYTSGNRINDQITQYDAAGNVVFDGVNSYSYDGEGRVCAVASHSVTGGVGAYQYVYDASGTRVAKGTINLITVGGRQVLSCDVTQNGFTPTNSYGLGLGGEQITETKISGGASVWAHTNVYSGGMLLATYDPQGLHFHIEDWLGSRRVQTNAFGQVEETCTNSPYGNNLNCSFPGNAPSSADDATEHHFTGKERDPESGLDYFGARYYASNMGRFISPDWSVKEEPVPYAKLDDPQSLNLYGYMQDNPLDGVDIDGHQAAAAQQAQATVSATSGSREFFAGFLHTGVTPFWYIAHRPETLITGPFSILRNPIISWHDLYSTTQRAGKGDPYANGEVWGSLALGWLSRGEGAAAEGEGIATIGGRKPINSQYAGSIHPTGVEFSRQGFPDFSPYAVAEVDIRELTGKTKTDAALANKAFGFRSTPKGYVWHHVENGTTMQLIPSDIHTAVRHTGGSAVIRNGGLDPK